MFEYASTLKAEHRRFMGIGGSKIWSWMCIEKASYYLFSFKNLYFLGKPLPANFKILKVVHSYIKLALQMKTLTMEPWELRAIFES